MKNVFPFFSPLFPSSLPSSSLGPNRSLLLCSISFYWHNHIVQASVYPSHRTWVPLTDCIYSPEPQTQISSPRSRPARCDGEIVPDCIDLKLYLEASYVHKHLAVPASAQESTQLVSFCFFFFLLLLLFICLHGTAVRLLFWGWALL